MKRSIALAVLSAALLACGPAPVVPPPPPTPNPQPNKSLAFALDVILIGCEGAGPNLSPAVYAWVVPGCPNAVESVISSLSAQGTAAQVQVAVTALQAFMASAPSTGLTQQDRQIIQSILGATQAFLVIYKQQTAGLIDYVPTHGFGFQEHSLKGVALTKAEKVKLKEIRKRAEALKKRKK